jgi:hypothetical protein
METRRWTNPGQPQTLQIAVFLLYINAVLNVLFGAVFNIYGLLFTVGFAFGGFGIANEKKWGYLLGLAAAIAPLAARLIVLLFEQISPFDSDVISLMFDVALVALLLHPQSRDYQRIWFK